MALRRLVFPLRRREELSREEFQRYWREHHALLARSHAATLGIQRYVQVHTDLDAEARPGRRDLATGTIEEQRAAGAELLEDEAKFIDHEASPFFHAVEHTIVDELGWTEAEPDPS